MANLKELRLRIGSVKNTRKITSAMSQIASAKLRRAQQAVLAARPYGERLDEVVAGLIERIDEQERPLAHPLLAVRPVETTLIIALAADRGLCGSFNGSITRTVNQSIEDERKAKRGTRLLPIGNRAIQYFRRSKHILEQHPAPTPQTLLTLAKTVTATAIRAFSSEDSDERVDQVVLYYNHFVSVLTQRLTVVRVLPFVATSDPDSAKSSTSGTPFALAPRYEPSRAEILRHLIPLAVESRLQQAMFNSLAAEIAARRVAMEAATDNASEMLADLTLEYNRERQAAITKELMEIIGGAEALKG